MLQGDRPAGTPGKGPPLSSSPSRILQQRGQQGCMQRSCCTALLALTALVGQQNGVFSPSVASEMRKRGNEGSPGDVG